MANEQQTGGKLDEAKGQIKEGVGNVTGNERMEREGQMDQAKGQVKEGVGNVREGVDNAADEFNRDR